jgi:hypothetical protein
MPMWVSGFSEAGSTILPSDVSWSILLEESRSFSIQSEFVDHLAVAKDNHHKINNFINGNCSHNKNNFC